MHVPKAVLLFSFLPSFLPSFFCFVLFVFVFFLFSFFFPLFFMCCATGRVPRIYPCPKALPLFPFLCHLYLDTLNHLPIPTTDPKNFPIAQNNRENCRAEQRGVPTLNTIQLCKGANEVCEGNKNRGQYARAPKSTCPQQYRHNEKTNLNGTQR